MSESSLLRVARRLCSTAPALVLAAAVALPACKPAGGASEPVSAADEPPALDLPPALESRAPDHERAPDQAATAPDADAAVPLAPREKIRHGTIERAALDAVLDRGPGAFLGGLELKPHFRDRRFTGWVIVRIRDDQGRLGNADLQPGDIVMLINGRIILRPRHLQALWVELRAADAIVVHAQRDGQPFELRFDVIDTPGVPAP